MSEPYLCTSCGSAVEDTGLAEHQLANVSDSQTPMCADCIETHVKRATASAFDAIRDALSPENRQEWDSFSFEEKFIRFLKYRDDGLIRPADIPDYPQAKGSRNMGSAADTEAVRLKAAKMRYNDNLGDERKTA